MPLANSFRPQSLSEFVGQKHLVGSNGLITLLLKNPSSLPSLIFWGPPGSGKTTLARLIAKETSLTFYEFSPVTASITDIKKVIPSKIEHSQNTLFSQASPKSTPLIFIDEIHRMNKAQQDALLPHVESGTITLIGATTENPSFEVIGPLLSRSKVVVFNRLSIEELTEIATKAINSLSLSIIPEALIYLIDSSNGDARSCLTTIEITANLAQSQQITEINIELLEKALQYHGPRFDRQGDEYYNTISALHKTIRGSDPNAAIYYLARMLEGGQDPLYIARRLVRAASEDIGLADSQALILANNAFEACDKIGMPECSVILAHTVAYLAKAPKSNAIYTAYQEASKDVKEYGNLPIPMHILNSSTKLMKDLGYGKDYSYHHSPTGKKDPQINYLPDKLKDRKYIPE